MEKNNYSMPANFRQKIMDVLGPHIFKVSKEDALMQAAVAVMDAEHEMNRFRVLMEAVRGELRTLAAIQMKQRGITRLILTKAEFAFTKNVEVVVETPEEGVRIYEMRDKPRPEVELNG